MSLITAANLLSHSDKLANAFQLMQLSLGVSSGNPVVNTVRNALNNLETFAAGLADYQQELDLVGTNSIQAALTKSPADVLGTFLQACLNDLSQHCTNRGSSVSASIVDLASFLNYYNGGAGATKFSNMVTKAFGDLWYAVFKTRLPYPDVMYESVSSLWGASPYAVAAYSNGFGSKVVGGAFSAGFAIDNTTYAEQNLIAVVTTNITGGTGAIQATATGIDDQGNAATWGPVTLTGGNNPTAALSQQTISSGSIAGQARVTVTVGSTTGIVVGSVLIVNKGKPDQEYIVAETINSATSFTAVFQKAHASSATIDGNTSTAMGQASTGAGRRCRSISAISFTLNGQSAGVVEMDGYADRISV